MAKIGIRKIKIAKKSEVPDTFFDKTGLLESPQVNFIKINFVQDSASFIDEDTSDENGISHSIKLTFTTRCRSQMKDLARFLNKPVIIMIDAVDGCRYIIGGKDTPAYLTLISKYDRLSVREWTYSCNYRNLNGLSEV